MHGLENFLGTTYRLLRDYHDLLIDGLILTVQLAVLCEVLAVILGLAVGLCAMSSSRVVRAIAVGYVEFFRDTPFLVQLFWIYYALPTFGIVIESWDAAVLSITLYIGSYKAEIFRAGIQAVPRAQHLAARGLGMSYFLSLRRVILPQAVRIMIPPFLSSFINLVKSTSFVSIIAVNELTAQGYYIAVTTFHSMEILTAIALMYFMIIYPLNLWVARFERKLQTRD